MAKEKVGQGLCNGKVHLASVARLDNVIVKCIVIEKEAQGFQILALK